MIVDLNGVIVATLDKVDGGTFTVTVTVILIQMVVTNQVVSVEQIKLVRDLYGGCLVDIVSTLTLR